MSPAPAPAWTFLGRNGLGEAVEENPAGHRRVATEKGWQDEATLPDWRACRARTPEAGRLAMASLGDPWISAGFGHNLTRAYVVYRLSPGQPFGSQPAAWAGPGDTRFKAFAQGVARHRGQRVTRAWLRHRPQAPDVPLWDQVIAAPSDTAFRGLQWGLAHRLERLAAAHPEWVFQEMGLVSPADAATARLPAHRRQILAARAPDAWAPPAQVQAGWPAPPGQAGTFGRRAAESWPASRVPVMWATGPALAAHGDPSAWWPALAAQPHGVVVLDDPLPAAGQALVQALRQAGRRAARVRLPGAQVWSWGLGEAGDRPVALEDWARPTEPPQPAPALPLKGERVPYRPLSRVGPAEGVAPAALEASMHAALRDLSHAHPDRSVDAWVAQALGLAPEALGDRLSPEQVDAVALARQSLDRGLGFLLSDETGFGKGRTLAALALAGLREGRTVVFVTENPYLFSDFYRDLCDMAPGKVPVPTLLHQSARVFDPQGRKVAASLKAREFQRLLARREWNEGEARLVFTTYAQVARAQDGRKIGWLKDRMGRGQGWLLLDEAHNAAGESAAGKRVEELIAASGGTVFASATFAKHEANLSLYKPVLALPAPAQRLLRLALAGDDGRLREALTQQMARAGRLVRREHPPVPPPVPVWVEMTPDRRQAVEAFAQAWRGIFLAAQARSRLLGLRESVWADLGAALSRSVREFSLQAKSQALVELIQAQVAADKKVVVVVDTTMEAALRAALTPALEDDAGLAEEEGEWEDDGAVEGPAAAPPRMVRSGEGPPPQWRHRLEAILDAVCPPGLVEGVEHSAAQDARAARARVQAALAALPDWDLAPLDRLRLALEAAGIAAGELSGRQTRLLPTATGWEVVNRADPDRNEVVRKFNAGEIDVLFVTRAGCAGISLHAGRKFADQRVRVLVEWDIAPNPVNRVQFWGRVRRKDQVVEPEFMGLALDTPEDRRIVEREDAKRRRLTAHMGARAAGQAGWISPLGEDLVAEWALERPQAAFLIGVVRPVPDLPLGRIDRALVRSIVLPPAERDGLLRRLDRGLALGEQAQALSRADRLARPSRAFQRAWWWGDTGASFSDPAQALAALRLDLVERVWRPEPPPPVEAVAAAVRQAMATPGAKEVLARWKRAWEAERAAGMLAPAERKRAAAWALERLPGLDPGQALAFTHPATGRQARAVVLDWDLPESREPGAAGASAWALSQLAVRVWAAGDPEPLLLPLAWLARDRAFRVAGKPAPLAWFKAPPVPMRNLAMEGHPVQAAAWGRRWGWGRSALLRDEDEGAQVVWLLPAHLGFEQALALPRDLVDVEHALEFWRAHPDATLGATLPHGQRLAATPVSGGLRLSLDQATLDRAQATWLHPGLARRLRLRPAMGEPGQWATVIPWKYVPSVLHGFAAAGVGWRMPARYLAWYQKTAPQRTRAKSG